MPFILGVKVLITVLLLLGPMLSRAAGGFNGGGGTGCVNSSVNGGRLTLLDFTLSNPQFNERIGPADFQSLAPGVMITREQWNQNTAFIFAQTRLDLAINRFPNSQALRATKDALSYLSVFVSRSRLNQVVRAFLPATSVCQTNQLVPLALYERNSILLDLTAWNLMGIKSRAGLLIHEALRQIQILHNADGTDADLQLVTALLFHEAFHADFDFDRLVFFSTIVERPSLRNDGLESFCRLFRSNRIAPFRFNLPRTRLACNGTETPLRIIFDEIVELHHHEIYGQRLVKLELLLHEIDSLMKMETITGMQRLARNNRDWINYFHRLISN